MHEIKNYCYFHAQPKEQMEKDCWPLQQLFPGRSKTLICLMGMLPGATATQGKHWAKARRANTTAIAGTAGILLLLLTAAPIFGEHPHFPRHGRIPPEGTPC